MLAARRAQILAEVIPDAEAEQLGRRLRERRGRHSLVGSSLPYAAIVDRGRLYPVDHVDAERVPFGRVEAFCAYLQRHLRSKRGIRPERLGLCLTDFSWRYNRRKLARSEQVHQLLTLIRGCRQVPRMGLFRQGALDADAARVEGRDRGYLIGPIGVLLMTKLSHL
jgi:hypothetical protein